MHPRRYPISCNPYGPHGPCGCEDCQTCNPQTQEDPNEMSPETLDKIDDEIVHIENSLDEITNQMMGSVFDKSVFINAANRIVAAANKIKTLAE